MAKNRITMVDIEALGDRGMALGFLEALRKSHNRHKAMLELLTNLLAQAKAGVHEEESNMIKLNENN